VIGKETVSRCSIAAKGVLGDGPKDAPSGERNIYSAKKGGRNRVQAPSAPRVSWWTEANQFPNKEEKPKNNPIRKGVNNQTPVV